MARVPGKKQRLERFLRDLEELSKKHQLFIGGCGECGSPWVSPPFVRRQQGSDEPVLVHLYWCVKCDQYGPYHAHHDC